MTYLSAEVAAVWVPVGVPAELVVHLHLGRVFWDVIDQKFEALWASALALYFCFFGSGEGETVRDSTALCAREREKDNVDRSVACERESFCFSLFVVDVVDRRKNLRDSHRETKILRNIPTLPKKQPTTFSHPSRSFRASKMASHLASLGKVGPTIGEHLSSSTKVALDEQKRGEMRLLILRGLAAAGTSKQSCPLGGKEKRKKTRACSLSLLNPDPHAANSETPSPKIPTSPPPPPSTHQRPSSASRASASSPSPGSLTTARATRSRRSRRTGSCRKRSDCGRWSARARLGPAWSATR